MDTTKISSTTLPGVAATSELQGASFIPEVKRDAANVGRSIVDGNSDGTIALATPKTLTRSQVVEAEAVLQKLLGEFKHFFEGNSPLFTPKSLAKDIASVLPPDLLIELIGSKNREQSAKSAIEQQKATSKIRESDFKEGQKKLEDAQKAQEKSEKLGGAFKWLSYIATAITIAVAILTLPSPTAILMLAGAVAGIVEMATADENGGGILSKGIAKVLETVLPKELAAKVAPFVLAVVMIAMTMGRSVVSTAGKALTLAKNAVMPIIKNIAEQLPRVTKFIQQSGNLFKTLNQGIQSAKAAATGTEAFSKISSTVSKVTDQVDDLFRSGQQLGTSLLQKTGISVDSFNNAKSMAEVGLKGSLATTQLGQAGVQAGAAVETYKALDNMADTEQLKALRHELDNFMEQLREFMARIAKDGESMFNIISDVLNSKYSTLQNIPTAPKG